MCIECCRKGKATAGKDANLSPNILEGLVYFLTPNHDPLIDVRFLSEDLVKSNWLKGKNCGDTEIKLPDDWYRRRVDDAFWTGRRSARRPHRT